MRVVTPGEMQWLLARGGWERVDRFSMPHPDDGRDLVVERWTKEVPPHPGADWAVTANLSVPERGPLSLTPDVSGGFSSDGGPRGAPLPFRPATYASARHAVAGLRKRGWLPKAGA